MADDFSKNLRADAAAYKSAKAIEDGQKLWCMWSKAEPYHDRGRDKSGFVVSTPQDMRRMGMDLLRLADALDEIDGMWEE